MQVWGGLTVSSQGNVCCHCYSGRHALEEMVLPCPPLNLCFMGMDRENDIIL
jgi:hypothetical protein